MNAVAAAGGGTETSGVAPGMYVETGGTGCGGGATPYQRREITVQIFSSQATRKFVTFLGGVLFRETQRKQIQL